jgi:type IV secretory pathway VirB10-like protein
MPNDEDVKVASELQPSVQFGKGPAYRQGRRMSVKAAIGCAIASLSAIAPIFLLSAPERPAEDAKERVKVPDGADLVASEKNVSLESYSAKEEKTKKERDGGHRHEIVIRYGGLQSIARPRAAHVPPGSLVKAVLVSGASNGPVRAELKEALQVNGETLLPEGAALLGSGQSTEDRLFIHFTKVVFRSGDAESIDAAAVDGNDKIAGIRGSKVGHYAVKLASAIGLNFVSGMAEGLQDKEAVGQSVVNRADAKNALLNGASHASLDLANETMTDLKNKPSILEVEAGREILVLFGVAE